MSTTDAYVLIPAAARELGISRQTMWRHVQQSHLPAVRIGRDYVILRDEFDRFKVERRRPGRPRADRCA